MAALVEVRVNLPKAVVDALAELASANATTRTEALRRVISSAKFFHDERARGGKVLIEGKDGSFVQVLELL